MLMNAAQKIQFAKTLTVSVTTQREVTSVHARLVILPRERNALVSALRDCPAHVMVEGAHFF